MAAHRAAVFDLDGTLLDSYEAIHDSLADVLAHFGRPTGSLAQTKRLVGSGLETLIARVLPPEHHAEAIVRFRARYKVNGPRLTRPMPGALALVEALKRRGVPMAIASNKPAVFSKVLLDGLGFAGAFAFIGGPDLGFPTKPAPDMALAALAALGSVPAGTLFVGDMPIDVETARACGMPAAVIPSGSSTREELAASGPAYILGSLDEVLPLFG